MALFRLATIRRHWVAFVVPVIAVAMLMIYAPLAPASAAAARAGAVASVGATSAVTSAADPYEECLTNDNTECVSLTGSEIAIIVGTTAGVASNVITGAGKVAIVYLVKKFLGWWDGPGDHTPTRLWSGYYEDGGDSGGAGANTNLCLAETSLETSMTFQPCGANGTVWIEEPDNNGGNYNFTRYSVNNFGCVINYPGYDSGGLCGVMTAVSLSNGSPLTLEEPEPPGGVDWQDFNP
ncbi:MAG TPA: hypothetical protein VK823_21690 [Streptosporangiaceae bacterium]|jgi:hypothetical protein|nr:hypothetical protein [Streptosporangiaceae bacterium]